MPKSVPVAVAVRYDAGDSAPRILARAKGPGAQQVLEIAKSFGIPVERQEWLAQALERIPVGHEVPEIYFELMAKILAQVYTLKHE